MDIDPEAGIGGRAGVGARDARVALRIIGSLCQRIARASAGPGLGPKDQSGASGPL